MYLVISFGFRLESYGTSLAFKLPPAGIIRNIAMVVPAGKTHLKIIPWCVYWNSYMRDIFQIALCLPSPMKVGKWEQYLRLSCLNPALVTPPSWSSAQLALWLSVDRYMHRVCCLFCRFLLCVCVWVCVCVRSLSHVRLLATPWTVARQAPLSAGFSRQWSWRGLPFLPPGDLPDPGAEVTSPASAALQAGSLPLSHCGSPLVSWGDVDFSSLERTSCFTVTTHVNHQCRQCVGRNSDVLILPVNGKKNIWNKNMERTKTSAVGWHRREVARVARVTESCSMFTLGISLHCFPLANTCKSMTPILKKEM